MKTIITGLLLFLCQQVMAGDIIVKIHGLRNNKGQIQIQIFKDQAGFKNEKPIKELHFSKASVKNGVLTVKIKNLPPDVYGLALVDDENSNNEMDYKMFLPKEGFGFSDYYHEGMSRPTFEDFDFKLGEEEKKVSMEVRYL